jgi:hypothetical protein
LKTVFVLGAGASVEAGLPISQNLSGIDGLNQRVINLAAKQTGDWRPVGLAIEWAHRQMMKRVSHDWEANVELLFNILDEAAEQPRLPASAVFRKMHRPARRANRTYQRAVASHTSSWIKKDVFRQAQQVIRESLFTWLRVDDADKARYMIPLLEYCRDTGSCIVSLNYDNVVESASGLSGVEVDDGISQWPTLRRLTFSQNKIPFIKLHGSLSWVETDERIVGGMKRRQSVRHEQEKDNFWTPRVFIFGGANKMTYEPPYPDLYAEFRNKVMESDAVCILGYSGSDPHVNQVLNDWAFSHDDGLFSEATMYAEIYERIFGVGPFHRLDTREDSIKRVRVPIKLNHTLKIRRHEWPKQQQPHTETFLQNLSQILDKDTGERDE